MKTFKQFQENYGALLIRAPDASITLADLTEKDKNIADISTRNILDELELGDREYRSVIKTLSNTKLVKVRFPELSIDKQFSTHVETTIPQAATNAGVKLNRKKIVDYKLKNITVAVLSDKRGAFRMRKFIEEKIEDMIARGRRDFRKELGKKLKRIYLVEKLYYASEVFIVVKRNFGLNTKTKTDLGKVADLDFQVAFERESDEGYIFKGKHVVPFAAGLISVKEFI